jgi:Flp pilus assembly secretin CpaC
VRPLLATVVVFLAATALPGAEKSAEQLYKEGQQAERSGEVVRAYLLYSQASGKDPAEPKYWLRSQTLRTRAVTVAKPRPRPVAFTAAGTQPELEVGAAGEITEDDLAEARQPQPPMELKASPERKDLDFRGDSRLLFERVAKSYGLDAVFDGDYQPVAPFRFRLDHADYREALNALQAATASFVIPVSGRVFLVAKDNTQKRADLEPTVTVVEELAAPVTIQEAQEAARAVQQALAIMRLTVDTQRRLVLFRDRVSRVRPAQRLFLQMMRYPALVSIEVEFLELTRAAETSYGLSLQTMFPLVNFGDWFHSKPSVPSGFTKFLTFGGGKTLFGIGVTDAKMFARMSRSLGRALLRTEMRATDGQAASVHVGDKYPIMTGGFLGDISGETSTFPPQFNFEDLGLVLKVTPKVHGMEEVTLDFEAEFKVLTGESFNNIPVISNRKMTSQIRLRTGEWAVVAGMLVAQETRSVTGPAGLSQVPGLGRLFREHTRSDDERQILLVLKPALLSLPPNQLPTQAVWTGSENRPPAPL